MSDGLPRTAPIRPVSFFAYIDRMLVSKNIVATCLPSEAVGVGTSRNDPGSVPAMRCPDADSRNHDRLYGVTLSFQVSTDTFECHALLPSNQAKHVFSDDPGRTDHADDFKHRWPEIAVIVRACSDACMTERLAGEAAGEDGVGIRLLSSLVLMRDRPDIAVEDAVRPVPPQDGRAERVELGEDVPDWHVAEDFIHRDREAADAGEEVVVP